MRYCAKQTKTIAIFIAQNLSPEVSGIFCQKTPTFSILHYYTSFGQNLYRFSPKFPYTITYIHISQ